MSNIFNRNYFNRAVLSCVLGVVSVTYIIPLPATTVQTKATTDIGFLHRIENLMKKIRMLELCQDKDSIYEALIELKSEVEVYLGRKIDISQYIDMAERELINKGVQVPHKQIKEIKHALQKKDKKNKNNNRRLASMLQINEYELDQETQEIFFGGTVAAEQGNEEKKKEEEPYMPKQLVFGVTLTLCGLFLMLIPIPVCRPWGDKLLISGALICGNCITTKIDADNKEKKKNDAKKS